MTKIEAEKKGYCHEKRKIFCACWYSVRGVPGCQYGRLPCLHIVPPIPGECPHSEKFLRSLKFWREP